MRGMSRIISCSTRSFGRFGSRVALETVATTDIGWIELPITVDGIENPRDPEPLLSTDSSAEEIKDVRTLLADTGLQLSGLLMTSGDPLADDFVSQAKRSLDIAAELGTSVVVGPAGDTEETDEMERIDKRLQEVGDHAAVASCTFCLATAPGLCISHYRMFQTMQSVEHAHVRLDFDTAGILYYNEHLIGEIALARVCHWVGQMRLSDSQGEFGKSYFPALGYGGAVDFVRALQLTRDCGFSGPYCIEVAGIASEGDLTLDEHRQRILDSLRTLRDCGYAD